MRIERRLTRWGLLASATIAIAVAGVSLREVGARNPDAWATLAAVLAVIAAVISAWTTQRVTELQEDALEPNPQPSIDVRSRYGLAQFRLTNKGQTAAHDLIITWKVPLRTVGGDIVSIGDGGKLAVLVPGDSVSVALGETTQFFKSYSTTTCSGVLQFNNASGDALGREFIVSAEHERSALQHDREEPKTHYELQKIPAALDKISDEIASLRSDLATKTSSIERL
jgi:hypothetical protein